MGAINVIVTIMNMRAPGMSYMKTDATVSSGHGSLLHFCSLRLCRAVLAGVVTNGSNRINTSALRFSMRAGGGDPVLFQHLFWFFGHPECVHQ